MIELLRDENGKFSSTRLVLLISAAVYVVAFVTNTFTNFVVEEHFIDAAKGVLGIGLAATGVRGWAKNRAAGEEDAGEH